MQSFHPSFFPDSRNAEIMAAHLQSRLPINLKILWLPIVASISVLACKFLEVQIFSYGLFAPLLFLLSYFLLFVAFLSSIFYLIKANKQGKQQAAIALVLITLSFYLSSSVIDAVKVDFYLHFREREQIVTQILANELKPDAKGQINLTSHQRSNSFKRVLVNRDGEALEVSFVRYHIGFGDGTANFVYRSDDRDLAITRQLDLPNTAPFVKVRKLQDRWFWKIESW